MSSSSKRVKATCTTADPHKSSPPAPRSEDKDEDAASDSEDDGSEEMFILIAKTPVSCSENCPCNTFNCQALQCLGAPIKHWALRVGQDVYELIQTNGVNDINRLDYDNVGARYEQGKSKGRTRARAKEIKRLAAAYIASHIGYDFVQANCQEFVRWLLAGIPRCDAPPPPADFQDKEMGYLLEHVWRYAKAKATTKEVSLRELIDKRIHQLQGAVAVAAIWCISQFGKLMNGINWLLRVAPQDAFTWIITGVSSALAKLKTVVEFFPGMRASAWNTLSSPLGLQILAGIAVVVVACGVVFLAKDGMVKFWRWWEKTGSTLDFGVVDIEMQDGEIVVRPFAGAVRPVQF